MEQQFEYTIRLITPYLLGTMLLLIYIAEHIFPQRKDLVDYKHDLKNILLGLVNMALVFVVGYYFQLFIQYSNTKNWGILQQFNFNFIIELLTSFLILDCFMYWWHRINHELPFLWFFHKYHHKDEKMNSTTAVRFHTGELVLSYIIRFLIFPILGISLSSVLLHSIILFPVILFHHSNLKITDKIDLFLRKFMVTPQMHRIHHSKIKFDTDSNYSSILPYWDMFFNSYHKKSDKPIKFGV